MNGDPGPEMARAWWKGDIQSLRLGSFQYMLHPTTIATVLDEETFLFVTVCDTLICRVLALREARNSLVQGYGLGWAWRSMKTICSMSQGG